MAHECQSQRGGMSSHTVMMMNFLRINPELFHELEGSVLIGSSTLVSDHCEELNSLQYSFKVSSHVQHKLPVVCQLWLPTESVFKNK